MFRNKSKQQIEISSNAWVNHFKSLLFKFKEDCVNLQTELDINNVDNNVNDIFTMPFTKYELYKSIKTLKHGRSGGPDGMVAEMITETISTIASVLLTLYKKIFY